MAADEKFLHRPISVTVEEVTSMETVRTLPAEQTSVIVNVKMNKITARTLARMILTKVLAEEGEAVDLVTFSLKGTLK